MGGDRWNRDFDLEALPGVPIIGLVQDSLGGQRFLGQELFTWSTTLACYDEGINTFIFRPRQILEHLLHNRRSERDNFGIERDTGEDFLVDFTGRQTFTTAGSGEWANEQTIADLLRDYQTREFTSFYVRNHDPNNQRLIMVLRHLGRSVMDYLQRHPERESGFSQFLTERLTAEPQIQEAVAGRVFQEFAQSGLEGTLLIIGSGVI